MTKHPMNIAIMVRAFIAAPRPRDMIYAPIDLAVETAKRLGERGHHVTLFAPIGSEVHGMNVTVETMNLRSLVKNQDDFSKLIKNTEALTHDVPGLWDRYMANEMFRRAERGEFDVLHFHHPESALSHAVRATNVPVLYTMHDPIYDWYRELFELYASKNQHFISISDNQRRDAPDLPYQATVYNGTDVDLFEFSNEAEDYLLFAGRITPQKGVKEAIQVAKDSDHRLLIIGPVADENRDYFEQYIKPELNDQILYLNRMDQDQLPKYYQKAKAVLTPVQWEEPFGLTTIEAMACGTPVISLRRGAASEIIKHGKTGFIVDSVGEMIEAVGKIDQIKRRDCRDHVRRKFNLDRMVDGYESAYRALVEKDADLLLKNPRKFVRRTAVRARKPFKKR